MQASRPRFTARSMAGHIYAQDKMGKEASNIGAVDCPFNVLDEGCLIVL